MYVCLGYFSLNIKKHPHCHLVFIDETTPICGKTEGTVFQPI